MAIVGELFLLRELWTHPQSASRPQPLPVAFGNPYEAAGWRPIMRRSVVVLRASHKTSTSQGPFPLSRRRARGHPKHVSRRGSYLLDPLLSVSDARQALAEL